MTRNISRFTAMTGLPVVAALVAVLVAAVVTLAVAAPADATVNVVATLPDLAALAHAVGGADVQVTALASPDQDPHYVDARPSLMLPLARADLLVLNGLQLEQGWLPPLLRGCRNTRVQVGGAGYLSVAVYVKRIQTTAGRPSRAMGDVHPGGNPHFLHDARAGARVAAAIGARLAQLDPTHAGAYITRTSHVVARLKAFASAEHARFAKLSATQRRVVSYHRSLTYLYDWLGVREIATVEPRPGIPPSPSHTAQVLTAMRRARVGVVVQETFYPRKVSQTLAMLAHGKVVIIPGGAHFSRGETYLTRLKRGTQALYVALAGQGGAPKPAGAANPHGGAAPRRP